MPRPATVRTSRVANVVVFARGSIKCQSERNVAKQTRRLMRSRASCSGSIRRKRRSPSRRRTRTRSAIYGAVARVRRQVGGGIDGDREGARAYRPHGRLGRPPGRSAAAPRGSIRRRRRAREKPTSTPDPMPSASWMSHADMSRSRELARRCVGVFGGRTIPGRPLQQQRHAAEPGQPGQQQTAADE